MTNPTLSDIVSAAKVAEPLGRQTTVIIGIDGCGGAGKTTFAHRLADQLCAQLIHTDDFASWNNPLNWQVRMLEQVLTPLSHNKSGRFQRYDWDLNALAEWHDVPVQPFVVLEGVSSTRTQFRSFLGFSIYVDAPQDIRLQRGLARDGHDALPLWRNWQRAEDEYLDRDDPKAHASLILDGTQHILDN